MTPLRGLKNAVFSAFQPVIHIISPFLHLISGERKFLTDKFPKNDIEKAEEI